MIDRCSDIITELGKGLEESIAFYKSLKPEELSVKVYQADDSWTVLQVLAHFITIEQSMHWLFNNILSGGPGSPKNFDVEKFNRTQPSKLFSLDVDELLKRFSVVRQTTISIVRSMDEKDLDREGLHAFHGHGRLERFIRWAYEHERIHEEEIRQALQIK
jgi:hypothetical protein